MGTVGFILVADSSRALWMSLWFCATEVRLCSGEREPEETALDHMGERDDQNRGPLRTLNRWPLCSAL